MATLKYFAQKSEDGYPIPGTLMGYISTPKSASDLVEIQPRNYTVLPGQVQKLPASGLRYFVRHNSTGGIIPNSLITSLKKPAGRVYEFKLVSGTAVVPPSNLVYGQNNVLDIFLGYNVNMGINTIEGDEPITYSVNKTLPDGLSLDPATGIISGYTTTDTDADQYIFTATNAGGSTSATVTITVKDAAYFGYGS